MRNWKMVGRSSELRPGLWEKLPQELVEKVLAKLPFSSLMSFRSVCKPWKAMIESSQVAQECHSCKPVVFYHHPGGQLGNPNEGEWVRPFLAFPNSKTNMWEKDFLPFLDSTLTLVAADEGLLCFGSSYKPDRFIIYNPLSKQWRELNLPSRVLPRLPRGLAKYENPFSYVLVGLVMNKETGNYKIIVTGIHEDAPREALLYDSHTGSWRTTAQIPPLSITLDNGEWINGGEWNCERGICCAGNLYWDVYEHANGAFLFNALVKYNVEREEWTIVKQSLPYDVPCHFHIAAHKGKVLLVDWSEGEVCDETSVCASELGRLGPEIKTMDVGLVTLSTNWRTLRMMPIKVVSHGEHLFVAHHPDAYYLDVYSCPEEAQAYRLLSYEDSAWLPECSYVCDKRLLCALAPTLRAFV